MIDRKLTTIADLADAGLLPAASSSALDQVAADYAIAVTPAIANVIDCSNPADPIARQFIPDANELTILSEESSDPISDEPFTPIKGIVHRYTDRALLKVVNICPVYCRFCFRREMVGPGHGPGLSDTEIDAALDYVAAHPEISELIMTGGDPLILSPRRLKSLTSKIAAIQSIKQLRWHTRVPVVMPDKINGQLIAALSAPDREVRIAIHANHANEFGTDAVAACGKLRAAGFELLSQSVLLKDINDSAAAIADLMQSFVDVGARPYYLHHGDLAPGTSHFRTTIAAGLELMASLEATLPKSMQPKYILDVPGGSGKVALTNETCERNADGSYAIRCRDGSVAIYRDVV